jgi:hypothetical protein
MLAQLFFANYHFGTSVFEALVFFATGWLYLDSWKIAKDTKRDLVRSAGFFLLAAVAMVHASTLEIPALILSSQMVKILALILIAGSLAAEPVLHTPEKEAAIIFPFILLANSLVPLSAALFLVVSLLYFRQSTEGLARQIKPAGLGFLALGLAELINVGFFASETTIVFWSKLLARYGLFWNASHLLEFTGIVILGFWTASYLRFKADLQLFITIVSFSLVVFIATTATFTFLLLRNLEADNLAGLKTDVGVMQYAMERLKLEALADARAVAKNSDVESAFLEGEKEKLFELTSELMLRQETNFLNVATASGEVVARAEDRERVGDSLTENSIFKTAISGTAVVTVAAKEGAMAPEIEVLAADSFINNTGAVITGFRVDNAFVDGVRITTGLDTSVYSKEVRVATTFIAPDGKSRFIGTKETDEKILATVLERGEIYTGVAKILNQPFYTAYAPLTNVEGESMGMLFVGKPQKELFETAQKSTRLTFTASAFFILLSIAPAYWVSRYIKENIKA